MAVQRIKQDSQIKGLLFDLDGTLVDSYLPIMESLNHVRTCYGLPGYSLGHIKKMVGRGLETLISEAVGRKNVQQGVSLFREKYKTIFIEKTKLLPQARSVIAELYRRGYALGVTSNKPSYFTKEILRSQKIYHYFKVVLGPDDVQNPKPHPDMINKAIQKLRIDKKEVLYVGDMVLDVQTGRIAGIKVYVVLAGSSSPREIEKARPDRILPHLQELTLLLPPLTQSDPIKDGRKTSSMK